MTTSLATSIDDVIEDLGDALGRLPDASITWALEHWDEARPRFLALLSARADGAALSKTEEDALFLIIHILAEKRETAAFAPLLRLLSNEEDREQILGDAVTETLRRVLISTFDGRLDALKDFIEAPGVDEFARSSALDALVYLTRTGVLSEDETRAYLRHLRARMEPRDESFVWDAWASAVANLGYEDFRGEVATLFEDGFIDPYSMNMEDFERQLARTLDDPGGMAGIRDDRIGPFESTIGRFSTWYAFTPEYLEDRARSRARQALEERLGEPDWDLALSEPVRNPARHVGRNDPCPCGSGKKFKKCCLELV